MIPSHASLYSRLSPAMAQLLASQLLTHGLVQPSVIEQTVGEDISAVTGEMVASWVDGLSHAQVVLTLARETSPLALDTMDALLQRPVYMCAMGETSEPLTDYLGRPLPLPVGARRGEATLTTPMPHVRTRLPDPRTTLRRDPRVIVSVAPNPKTPGSAAHQRYQLYGVGMRVDEALTAGLRRLDIEHDTRRGFIEVVLPTDPRAAEARSGAALTSAPAPEDRT